jgi:hypothetical protein
MGLRIAALLLAGSARLSADVVDRIAVVVGNTVFTESEVLQAVRLTEFVNGDPLDVSAQARRDAADKLVDQQLIRNEMALGHYAPAPASDGDKLVRAFRQQHYRSIAQYHAALQKYGITEDQLKTYLLWQESVLRFTDMRFKPGLNVPIATQGTADRSVAGSPTPPKDVQTANRVKKEGNPTAGTVDEQLDSWLKQTRASTRVVFKQGAFQ